MANEHTLVEIKVMPSVNHNSVWKQRVGKEGIFPTTQGLVIKGWTHWSDHIECKAQYLDILEDGQVVRYWRPTPGASDGWNLEVPGLWEIAGEGRQSYEISPVQCTINE